MKKTIVLILIILCFAFLQGCIGRNVPLSEYSGGEFLSSSDSPDGKYTVNAYIYRGSATEAETVRAELVDNDSGTQKNIYLKYREQSARCEWLDNTTVAINGIELDVRSDTYDWRRDKTD